MILNAEQNWHIENFTTKKNGKSIHITCVLTQR